MRLLINFSTLKAGGGQNVAMNFLLGLESLDIGENSIFFLVAKNSEPHKYLRRRGGYRYYVAPRNPVLRLLFERMLFTSRMMRDRIDVVYTYFGFGLFGGGIKQISGSADSNIYYPEIDFWCHYKGIARFKKKLVDAYRIWGVKRASAVVYENEALLQRSTSLYGIVNAKLIRPSIAVSPVGLDFLMPANVPASAYKALFLCGWQLNKNIMLIPDIALAAKKKGMKLHFLLTAPPDDSPLHREFRARVSDRGVSDMVTVTGPVDKTRLADLYSQVDVVMLLSKLESFSNNIIEAWYFRKPLITADEEWARALCGNAAFYVSRDDSEGIASALLCLSTDEDARRRVVENGLTELGKYPTIEQRIREELEYAEHIYRCA